jgi:hypothetical protein
MINVQNISSKLAIMPDEALRQFAAMHKEDPYTFSLAMFESNRRKQVRSQPPPQMDQTKVVDKELADMRKELPENLGIARLPVDMNMASGGIVAFDDGGMTHYDKGGNVKSAGSDPKLAYRQYAITQANKMGLDPALVDSIFQIESKYNPNAVSPKGAVGIGQLMPETSEARNLDRKDRTDPYRNIDVSLQEMKSLQAKYKNDTNKIAAAYNWGQGNLDKHLQQNDGTINTSKLPKETQSYLKQLTDLIPLSSANAEVMPQAQATKPAAPASTEADRSVTGQLKSIGQGIAGIPSAIGNVVAPEGAGGYAPGTRNFFERAADVVGIPEEFQREFSGGLNAVGGAFPNTPLVLPKAAVGVSRAAQAARAAEVAEADLKATQAEAKIANLRLPPQVPKAQGIEALSEEERVRRGLGATTPVVPAKPLPDVNAVANMSEAERLKRGLSPRGPVYPLGPDAIKMQQELLARRGQVGNIGAKAPSGIEALTTPQVAPTKFPLGKEALEMNQKLKAAKDALALRNLRADEQAAEAARKAATATANASKAAEAVEMAKAAKAANVVNKVIEPANQAIKTVREVQAVRNADAAADQITFPSETKPDAVTPPYRPNETQELLKKYPAPTSVKPSEGSDVKPVGPSKVENPLEKIEDLNKGVGRRDAGGDLSPKAKTAIADAAKDAVPKTEDNSGWSKDDWVQFGLALMAGKSSNALTNVGEAGLSLLASKQARDLKNRELDLYKQVHMEKPGEREKAVQKLMDANPSLTYEQALARYAELTTATGEREKAVKQIMDERKVPYSKALEIYIDTIESPYKMEAIRQRAEASAARTALGEARLGETENEKNERLAFDRLTKFYAAKKDLNLEYPSALRTGSSASAKARQAEYEEALRELQIAFKQVPAKAAPAASGPLVKVTGVKP